MSNSLVGFEKMIGKCVLELEARALPDESVIVYAWTNSIKKMSVARVCDDLAGFISIHGCDPEGVYKSLIIPSHQAQFELLLVKKDKSGKGPVGFMLSDPR